MKTEDITWFKEYLATERGVAPSEISDNEAIANYKVRRRTILVGFFLMVFLYLCLRILGGAVASRVFVTVVTLISVVLCLARLRWHLLLEQSQKLAIKKELSALLFVNPDQVSNEFADQFARWDWRHLTLGLAIAAVTTLTFDWIRPGIPIELIDLSIFYLAGTFAWRRLRRPVSETSQAD